MTWENKELEAIPSESARQRIVGPDQLPEDGQEVSLRPRCLAVKEARFALPAETPMPTSKDMPLSRQ